MIRRFGILFFIIGFATTIYAQDYKPLKLESLLNEFQKVTEKEKRTSQKKRKLSKEKNALYKVEIKGCSSAANNLILNELNLSRGDSINSIKVNRYIKRIQSLGLFSDVTSKMKKTKQGVILVLTVKENPKVTKIVINGNTKFSDSDLKDHLQSKEQDIVNIKLVRSDIKNIEQLYKEKGYSQAKIYQIETPKDKDEPLTFYLAEGVVEEIVVTGNTKTKDYVILREMNTKPGMVLQDDQIKEDLRRVYNLNYFTNLQPEFIPGKKVNTHKLRLHIEERPSNAAFTFGGGYSPIMGMSIYSDLYWDNLMGTGQLVLLKGQFGRATTYQIKYHNPWMWDDRKSFTFKTWHTDGEMGGIYGAYGRGNIIFRDETRKGVELGIGWPFSYEFRSGHSIKVEDIHLKEDLQNNEIDERYAIYSYQLSLSHDTRDVWFNPTKGHFYTFNCEKSLPFSDSALDFVKVDVGFKQFIPTFEKQAIACRFDVGYLGSSEISDENKFVSEWYYVGGGTTVRGYNDLEPFAYGNKSILASLEYRFLFNDMFQVLLFVDSGFATLGSAKSLTEFDNYKVGKGVGIRFNIPGMGPLRLDYGMGEKDAHLHFNIGHAF